MTDTMKTPKVAKSIEEAKQRLKKVNKDAVKANNNSAKVKRGV